MNWFSKKISNQNSVYILATLRIILGLTFFWAFIDKLIGLGFSTCKSPISNTTEILCNSSWLKGGSPTKGFLNSSKGPLSDIYHSLAGSGLIDFLFMVGLLLIGLSLILGIGIKIAAVSGITLTLMMWSSILPPKNNPLLDEHIIYALVLAIISTNNNQQAWGLRNWWVKTPLVKRFLILE